MKVLFNSKVERVYTRKNSLGKMPLVVADDVMPLSDVVIKYTKEAIRIELAEVQEKGISPDTEFLFIGPKVGIFGGNQTSAIESVIDVLLCDTVMVVILRKGAISILIDDCEDRTAVASSKMEGTPAPHLNEITWKTVDAMSSLLRAYKGDVGEFPADHLVCLIIRGEGGRYHNTSIRKIGEQDISFDKIESIHSSRALRARQLSVGKMRDSLLVASEDSVFVNFESDEDEDVEEDDDDDDDADLYL